MTLYEQRERKFGKGIEGVSVETSKRALCEDLEMLEQENPASSTRSTARSRRESQQRLLLIQRCLKHYLSQKQCVFQRGECPNIFKLFTKHIQIDCFEFKANDSSQNA